MKIVVVRSYMDLFIAILSWCEAIMEYFGYFGSIAMAKTSVHSVYVYHGQWTHSGIKFKTSNENVEEILHIFSRNLLPVCLYEKFRHDLKSL